MKETIAWVAITVIILSWLFSETETMHNVGNSLIEKMAAAIEKVEGWFPGSRSQRNNNPGNLRWNGGEQWQGQIGVDSGNFIIFDSYNNGKRALMKLITNAATGQLAPSYDPRSGLYSFFQRYAPSSDNNDPKSYAEQVAAYMQIDVNTPISQFV